jgi:hypothetical protein
MCGGEMCGERCVGWVAVSAREEEEEEMESNLLP